MGPVSGFVLRAPEEPTLYIAGDTIWCDEVAKALTDHAPDVVVLNAGAAQFLQDDPITMTSADVISVCQTAPQADVITVHMETINHCGLTRAQLASEVAAAGLSGRVAIPHDGDTLTR
jgi:L-ascorbate metabolism protein UlaG (beta-lactamase superfamily)